VGPRIEGQGALWPISVRRKRKKEERISKKRAPFRGTCEKGVRFPSTELKGEKRPLLREGTKAVQEVSNLNPSLGI